MPKATPTSADSCPNDPGSVAIGAAPAPSLPGQPGSDGAGAAASNLDFYQVNCTYYDALGKRDNEYLIARALQFFAPGIPQVYYIGLLGGVNDMDLLNRTKVGRDINRHYYTPAEVKAALDTAVVRKLFKLARFRNTHPAFNGDFSVEQPSASQLVLSWTKGDEYTALDVDFMAMTASISHKGVGGDGQFIVG